MQEEDVMPGCVGALVVRSGMWDDGWKSFKKKREAFSWWRIVEVVESRRFGRALMAMW